MHQSHRAQAVLNRTLHKRINPKHRHIITLGIGANLGTRQEICKRFAHLLDSLTSKDFTLLATSPILYNPPFGYTNQPYFYNATITLATSLSVVELFARVFYLERRFGRGRKRAFKNAPRTLDIDIIFYDKVIIKRAYLTIPHGEFHKRESILLPLSFETMYLRSGSCRPLLTAVRPQPRH
ncbi:2-amino-4-hydroxy-6-hydroxymethyldihydropteridine diphosphokinase [Helicobacter sp.]|uniref:2-amino-4-hydroxy-6- hydroxymethyldihydropteridine diphosphokinase n=1 Tax=Helicobacter sp. TaxID=218 RepID=UPI00388EADEA